MKHSILKGMLLVVLATALIGCTLVDPTGYSPSLAITGGVSIVGSGGTPTSAFTAAPAGYVNDTYRYSWKLLDESDEVIQTGDEAEFTPAARTVTADETMTVQLTVTDGYVYASAETEYLITVSTTPVAMISGGAARVLVDGQVTIPYSVNYANFVNTPVIAWSVLDSNDDPVAQSGTTDAVTFTPDAISGSGEFTVSVTLTDGATSETATKALLIVEAMPMDMSFLTVGSTNYTATAAGTAVAPAIQITGTSGFSNGLITADAFGLSASEDLVLSLSVTDLPEGDDGVDIQFTPDTATVMGADNILMVRLKPDSITLFVYGGEHLPE